MSLSINAPQQNLLHSPIAAEPFFISHNEGSDPVGSDEWCADQVLQVKNLVMSLLRLADAIDIDNPTKDMIDNIDSVTQSSMLKIDQKVENIESHCEDFLSRNPQYKQVIDAAKDLTQGLKDINEGFERTRDAEWNIQTLVELTNKLINTINILKDNFGPYLAGGAASLTAFVTFLAGKVAEALAGSAPALEFLKGLFFDFGEGAF
jgi:ABC-type transporter Mla subunit MlaD